MVVIDSGDLVSLGGLYNRAMLCTRLILSVSAVFPLSNTRQSHNLPQCGNPSWDDVGNVQPYQGHEESSKLSKPCVSVPFRSSSRQRSKLTFSNHVWK